MMLMLTVLLASCREASVLPQSGGRPYEVLLVGDGGEVAEVLATDAEVLPQREPCFDVTTLAADKLDARMKLARSIVEVRIDPTLTRSVARYEKNVYARPQMVVRVSAPSREVLRRDMPRWAPGLLQLLTRHEMNAAIATLRRKPNPKAAEAVREVFGAEMDIPATMQASKRGKDFLWFSNNTVQGMQNLCVYSFAPGNDFAKMRDSVMRSNIPGEEDGMFMQTVGESLKTEPMKERNVRGTIFRGLWEMHGDAMGGPFVAHAVVDSANQRILVAEAFVYAPEATKRNKLRQIEAALYTLQPKRKQETTR